MRRSIIGHQGIDSTLASDPQGTKDADFYRSRFHLDRSAGLDHNFGQRCLVRTADPTIRPRSVGSAVRTNDLAAGAVAGIMTKAAQPPAFHCQTTWDVTLIFLPRP